MKKRLKKNQMPGTGNREEFRQTLDNAQGQSLPKRHDGILSLLKNPIFSKP